MEDFIAPWKMVESMAGVPAQMFMVAMALLVLALLLSLWRLWRGPLYIERAVAMDLLAVLALCFMALFALFSGRALYIDIALGLAVMGFVGNVAVARFVERRRPEESEK